MGLGATLGAIELGNLGGLGTMMRIGWRDGGARRHHDSKMSQILAVASVWVMLVGRRAPEMAPAMQPMDDSVVSR